MPYIKTKTIFFMSLLIMTDSNVIIDEYWQPAKNADLWKAARKSEADIVVDETILSEVRRKTGKAKDAVIEKITESFKRPIQIDDCQEVQEDARRMNKKYLYLHNGDDRILAATKKAGAVLVTNDKKFLVAASLEGVQSYSSKTFVKKCIFGFIRKWSN